jgi:hypothetical protein
MNNIEQISFNQSLVRCEINQKDSEICRDIRQAIIVVNTEYQQLDWEDTLFLNRVLNNALKTLEAKGAE